MRLAVQGRGEVTAQGFGHRLLADQEDLIPKVIVVRQHDHRHIGLGLVQHQIAESAPAAGMVDLAILEAWPNLIAQPVRENPVAPVAACIQVSQRQGPLQAGTDAGCRQRDFARDEVFFIAKSRFF